MPTKFRVISFVQENFSSNLLHHNVPWVDRSRAAHQGRQDGVSGKDVDFRLGSGQLPDDGIVGGGDSVEDTVDAFEGLLIFDVDTVVSFVVIFESSGADTEKYEKTLSVLNSQILTKDLIVWKKKFLQLLYYPAVVA